MNDYFEPKQLKDITYIGIETSLKRDPKDKVTGLFLGLRQLMEKNNAVVSSQDSTFVHPDNEEMLIWIIKDKHVDIVNPLLYNIDKIEVGRQVSVSNTLPKITYLSDPHTQIDTIKNLVTLMEAMRLTNRILPNGLIDTGRYFDIPKDLADRLKLAVAGKESIIPHQYKNPAHTASNKPLTKPKPIDTHVIRSWKASVNTTSFHRTTKYPVSTAIERMHNKIKKLRTGKYEPPKLDEIVESTSEVSSAQQKADEAADNYYDSFCG